MISVLHLGSKRKLSLMNALIRQMRAKEAAAQKQYHGFTEEHRG